MRNFELFVIGGASGSGKTMIMNSLKCPSFKEIISITTREPREGELDKVHYYFLSKEKLKQLKRRGKLAVYLEFKNTCYGISIREINKKLKNSPAYVITSYDGLIQLKRNYQNITSIYIDVSYNDFILNLLHSENFNMNNVKRRITTYDRERKYIHNYDYVVRNVRGKLDLAIKQVKDIILRRLE